ncbi:sec1 family domain-containing protein 1 isoform X2 [Strigops habroptila]|uniref:sec1 family domain-containing protein 1 isoform X2 n=1 Tax=Strigops habroptila TaxID=2489341 RepID=UPI0011CF66C1|nr:sec1 family domain-containing protein 1 isoform X2 [Strigops habroptila]
MAAGIREKQTVALKRMLNFNVPPVKNSTGEPVWKVLIYDRFGQDIISPLLSVKELRDMGITLHLLLHSDRDAIPDVPAVYFVMPTEENIDRMCQVFDQYLNFITLEDDMFVLCNQNKELVSYRAINRPDITDTEMETIMDTIVDSLFCFFVTLGAIPIIRCSRGTAAEMVAVKLDKKLRENLRDARNSLFTGDTLGAGQFSFQRPLLVLVDRNIDLATPLHHTWTYQALVHDVLDFHLNRVNLEESTGTESSPAGARPKKKNKKSYDLTMSDKFWQKHKGSPFPEVAESVQQELESYRAQEDEVKRLKSIMGIEGEDEGAISMLSDNTAKLTSAVSSLPELLEKKRLIDLHTNVATAVLEHIKSRKLDVYFEYEEKIMSKSTLDKSLLDMISDPDAGTPEDKMRLFLIYYISSAQAPSEIDLEQYKKALTDAGCNLAPLSYIKQWKAFTKMASAPTSYGNTTPKPLGLLSRVMNTGSQFVMEGVKNLVLKQQNLPVTRILDNLMEMKSNPETDDYRYFDPKMLRGSDSSVPRNKNPFQEAIVFVVGGGNYIEYQNLIDYIKGKQGKHILYGCSELFNAIQFIKQLSQLGQK